jgi:hypothetical protein
MSQLVRVPAKRFQIIQVKRDIPIKALVAQHDLRFTVGHGFYELGHKPVLIQGTKQIVLWHKQTKELFTGIEARRILGLPLVDKDVKYRKRDTIGFPYKVFVQSTSHNRKLLGGTLFLYEIEGWDKTPDTIWERIVDIDFV